MVFRVDTIQAPAGFFSYLKVSGVTEDVWKMYDHRRPGFHTVTSNPRATWGKTEEDSKALLRKSIRGEITLWEKRSGLRPSQILRLEILKQGLISVV